MTWAEADEALGDGREVRRTGWECWLRRVGNAIMVIYADRTVRYRQYRYDAKAADWEVRLPHMQHNGVKDD